jgi:hypothetical protein
MTIENTVKNFSNNIGNGVNLGVHFKSIIDHVMIKRDTTPLVKIINAAINRSDKDIASSIRVTLSKIYIGAKIKTKANKVVSIQIKDATLSNSAVKALSDVAGTVSMRGANWKKAFTPDTEPKAFDVAVWAARQATSRPDQLEAMIAALQAQRATVSKKKAA